MNNSGLQEYKSLYKVAYYSTILMLMLIPLQILVFAITKFPDSTGAWFELFHTNTLIGLFHSDFFILINNILISLIYLAFYHVLKKVDKGIIQIGVVLGLLGIAAYISSNKTFELMKLSQEYFATTDESIRKMIEAAGKASLAGWQGTAFDTYYVLNGITLFCISYLMYKSNYFTKATATWGLAAAIFMVIPSTAGVIGLIFSLLSLIPWYVFSIQYARKFKKFAQEV